MNSIKTLKSLLHNPTVLKTASLLERHGARFRQKFALADAIGSHDFAPPLETLACV
jgi:hypothetical protein